MNKILTKKTRGVASPVKKEEPKQWVVSYLPTARSRKPRHRIGFGETPEDAIQFVLDDNKAYNESCELYGWKPEPMFSIVGAEPYIDPWKR